MEDHRRLQYLAAMGVDVWRLRAADAGQGADSLQTTQAAPAEPATAARASATDAEPTTQPPMDMMQDAPAATAPATARSNPLPTAAEPTRDTAPPPAPQPPPPAQPATRAAPSPDSAPTPPDDEPPPWFDADFAQQPMDDAEPMPPPMPAAAPQQPSRAELIAAMDWPELEQAVAGCRACDLCQRRNKTVFGVGDRAAAVMFIGEGPGADEDRQGEPFVGRAGQLLNRMLAAAGLGRPQVYIGNIVKCRPPGNRDPNPDEALACRPHLERQIALVQPRLIVCLGRVPAHNLLGTAESVGRLRGRLHHYGPAQTPLLVTYHPSYYLRSPEQKAKGWQDLQRMLEFVDRPKAAN